MRAPVLVALAGLALLPGGAGATTLTGTVSDVVDGDTVKVVSRGFETPVRLIGIDTPETRRPGTPVQCWGPQASDLVHRLLPAGTAVGLVTDPTQDTRDRYGRLLAYVYRAGRRTSINYALVRVGYAKVYVYRPSGPFRYASAYRRAQARARAARLGLWGPPCNGDTSRPAPPGPIRAAGAGRPADGRARRPQVR